MSSCLSGGGQTAYVLDLDIIKSSSSSSFRTSHSSSPSSTLSESSNSPITISTRKPRTPRKRPNQTYNEAAALLSTAYPNIFSTKPCKFFKPHHCSSFSFEDELLLPFPVEKPLFHTAYEKPYSPIHAHEIGCQPNLCDNFDDFDTESILDEEIEEGVIDSIMGDLSVSPKDKEEPSITCSNGVAIPVNFCYGYPMGFGFGLGFEFGYGMMRSGGGAASAFRQNHGDWWRYPIVDVGEISPTFKVSLSSSAEKKKKVQKMNPKPPHSISIKQNSISSKSSLDENSNPSKSSSTSNQENPVPVTKPNTEMLLKLNYDEVLNAWSDRGSPFSEDTPGSEFSGSDALARLAQIDLFGENGGLREASVQRYKEKRRTRFFSKKIRYQVRKVNADQRPRMKGRFVRRSNSSSER